LKAVVISRPSTRKKWLDEEAHDRMMSALELLTSNPTDQITMPLLFAAEQMLLSIELAWLEEYFVYLQSFHW
jgi:hypothetical protein